MALIEKLWLVCLYFFMLLLPQTLTSNPSREICRREEGAYRTVLFSSKRPIKSTQLLQLRIWYLNTTLSHWWLKPMSQTLNGSNWDIIPPLPAQQWEPPCGQLKLTHIATARSGRAPNGYCRAKIGADTKWPHSFIRFTFLCFLAGVLCSVQMGV